MRKNLLILLLIAFLLYCVQEQTEQKLNNKNNVIDMSGRQIGLEKLEKIVVLSPEGLEMLYLFGEVDKIVGIDMRIKQTDPILPKIVNLSTFTDVGTASRPNVEAIISLNPDLVITYYCNGTYGYEMPKEIVEKLENAKIPVFGICIAITRTTDWDQYYEMVEKFGRLFGKEDRAKEINNRLKSLYSDFQKNLSVFDKKFKVVYTWSEMNKIAGNSTIVSSIITLAGGINIGSDFEEPYPAVSPEFIIEKNPDIWIINSWRASYNSSDILNDLRFKEVMAVKEKRVFKEPYFGTTWHPIRAHLYLLWHGKTYYGIPDFDLKANKICKEFYNIDCL